MKKLFKISENPPFAEMWKEACEKARKKKVGVVVEIKAQTKTRTTGERSQNHHLNGHIQQICEETGNDFQDVKEYIKSKAVSMGYPMLIIKGQVVVNPYGEPRGISEADSSTSECALLIEQTHMLASEYGIILKESEDE